jgi:hypothetical protein
MTQNERNVARLMSELQSNFETGNFEASHLAEATGNLVKSMETAGVSKQMAVHRGGEREAKDTITSLIANSQGDLNIIVTRLTANINQPLPFALFGVNDYATGYGSTLKAFIPVGVAAPVVTVAAGGIVDFSYTTIDGAHTDHIQVSFAGSLNSYLQFLQSMNQNFFKSKFILYSISDVAQQKQYGQLLNFGELSSLGMAKANQLSINSRIMTWDFKSDRANILMQEQSIDAAFSFVQNIMPVAGFSVEFDVFMSQRLNMNKAL